MPATTLLTPRGGKTARRLHAAAQLLEFYYPVHYRVGMALENVLCGGRLTRMQVAILWLIRSEGEQGELSRKTIERWICGWFEANSSAVTKSLQAMARPPLGLVRVLEHPHSGRERQVMLTPKGARHLETMVERGQKFVQKITDRLAAREITSGIKFLRRSTGVLDGMREQGVANRPSRRLIRRNKPIVPFP